MYAGTNNRLLYSSIGSNQRCCYVVVGNSEIAKNCTLRIAFQRHDRQKQILDRFTCNGERHIGNKYIFR